jgi:hypothetical protein
MGYFVLLRSFFVKMFYVGRAGFIGVSTDGVSLMSSKVRSFVAKCGN